MAEEFILAARSASFQVVIKQVSISTSPVPTGLANVRSHAVVGHVLAKVHCFLRNSGGADSTATALQQVGLLCRASFAGVGVAGNCDKLAMALCRGQPSKRMKSIYA